MKIDGVNELIRKEIIDLAVKYDVKKFLLYGSRARGDFKRTSDIDLAIRGGNYSAFATEVDDTTSTLLEFDIVNLDGNVKPELFESIEREGIVLYEKI